MKRSHILLSVVLVMVLVFIGFIYGRYAKVIAQKPFRPICWINEGKDLPNFTPAYWVERDGIKHMDYEIMRMKCRGEISGYMMDWDADQFFLRRTGIKKVTTR